MRLPGTGPQHVLRTLDDALTLRELLGPGLRLAIVGAGWIGAELATAAAGLGCQVTVLEAGPAPLAAAIGRRGRRLHHRAGMPTPASTCGWARASRRSRPGGLALAGGGWLDADVVVTAVGVRPAVSWLAGSGVELDNGIAVDARPADQPAGRVRGRATARPSSRAGTAAGCASSTGMWRCTRPEVAAANVLGGAADYDPVPYFWSEQFGRMVQYVGYHGRADRLLWRGDPAADRWAVAWLAGDRLAALLTVGLPRDLQQGRRVISSAARSTPPGWPIRRSPVRDAVLA